MCLCVESLDFWCDLKKVYCFFVRFIRVLEFSPESFLRSKFIVTNTIPKAIVFPYIFYSLHKICVFFPQFGIHNIEYGDGNHLSAVRTRDLVTYLFPLAGTLRMARLTTACQCRLTCHGLQTNHTLHFLCWCHHSKVLQRGLVNSWNSVSVMTCSLRSHSSFWKVTWKRNGLISSCILFLISPKRCRISTASGLILSAIKRITHSLGFFLACLLAWSEAWNGEVELLAYIEKIGHVPLGWKPMKNGSRERSIKRRGRGGDGKVTWMRNRYTK